MAHFIPTINCWVFLGIFYKKKKKKECQQNIGDFFGDILAETGKETRKIGGGSIATIGSTALGYTKEDKTSFAGGTNEIEVEFFHDYGQHHVNILGDAWADAIHSYLDKYPVNWSGPAVSDSWIDTKVVQSWVLIGDPSLRIGGYP